MAASGTCLQVLTASNLIYYAVHNEQILWNIYLEATEEKKELTWARIADISGLNKTRSSNNNVIVIVVHF